MSSLTIDQIYRNYLILRDTVKVTRRAVKGDDTHYLYRNTAFEYSTFEVDTSKAIQELEELIVLSLFAAFERWLRDTVLEKSEVLETIMPTELGIKLSRLAKEEIERWKTKEIIRLFDYASKQNTMKLMQILDFRNWVAHGKNIEKLPAITTDAKTVYETIIGFMNDIDSYTGNNFKNQTE